GRQEASDVLAPLVDQIADAEEDRGLPGKRDGTPRREGLLRHLHRPVDLVDAGEVHRPGLDALRRVVDRPAPPGGSLDDTAADPVADPLDVLLSLDGWGG